MAPIFDLKRGKHELNVKGSACEGLSFSPRDCFNGVWAIMAVRSHSLSDSYKVKGHRKLATHLIT